MVKWILTITLILGLAAYTKPIFRKLLGKLFGRETMPGDITMHVFGRKLYLPFGSTVLFSFIATCLYWSIR